MCALLRTRSSIFREQDAREGGQGWGVLCAAPAAHRKEPCSLPTSCSLWAGDPRLHLGLRRRR